MSKAERNAPVHIDRRSFGMTLSVVPGEAAWRSRNVYYYAGDWTSIQTVLPEFELMPFSAGPDEPSNPIPANCHVQAAVIYRLAAFASTLRLSCFG